MSEVSNSRHTFHCLDAILPSRRVATLDGFFKNLDETTRAVEGKHSQHFSRMGYHLLRGTAFAVQCVAVAIFTLLSLLPLTVYYCAKLSTKAATLLFVSLPSAAKKRFFPSAADLHEKRVQASKAALNDGIFSTEHILGNEKRLTYHEQKHLLHALLIQPLKNLDNNEYNEFCNVMNQLIDRMIDPAALTSLKEKAQDLIQTLPENFQKLARTFILALEDQIRFERNLTTDQINQNPKLLLDYPHLLIEERFEAAVNNFPKSLKAQLLQKKMSVWHHFIAQVHDKELNLFDALICELKDISLDKIQKYHPDKEAEYLEQRDRFLTAEIEALENKGIEAGFDYYLLKFEQHHVHQHQQKCAQFDLVQERADLGRASTIKDQNDQLKNQAFRDLCERIKTRLTNLKQNNNTHIVTECRLEEESLEKIKISKGSISEKIKELRSLIEHVQNIERNTLNQQKNANYLSELQRGLKFYENTQISLAGLKNIPAWSLLTSTLPSETRIKERQNNFAGDVAALLLETKPECQLPLLLAKLDVRSIHRSYVAADPASSSSQTKVAQKIEDASKEFVNSVRSSHLNMIKKQLLSETQDEGKLEIGHEKRIDWKALSLNLQVEEQLKTWYASLQTLWIESMPREQEEMLRSASNSSHFSEMMAHSFKEWLELETGKTLDAPLTFSQDLPNHTQTREHSLQRISSYFNGASTIGRFRKKLKRNSKNSPPNISGFSPTLLEGKQVHSSLVEPMIGDLSLGIDKHATSNSKSFENIVDGLEKIATELGALSKANAIQWKSDWIHDANKFSQDCKCASIKPLVLAECQKLIDLCFTTNSRVPQKIHNLYFSLYSIGQHDQMLGIDFNQMYNAQRGPFLAYFLKMHLSSVPTPIDLSEEAFVCLRQLCVLSSLSKQEIETLYSRVRIKNSTRYGTFVTDLLTISKMIQASPVKLQGIDAETVRNSIKNSSLPSNIDTRALLDNYASAGNDAFSFYAISYVFDYYKDLDHNQAREAIARSLIHSHRYYPEQTKEYILKKIEDSKGNLDFDPKTLAPPLYLFYTDLLRQLAPEDYLKDTAIQTLVADCNNKLLQEKEVHHLLMGYSRKISELCSILQYQAKQNPTAIKITDVLELLRYKIAYQSLKKNSFDQKIVISDFLKIESDLAESAMIEAETYIQGFLCDPTHTNEITIQLNNWTQNQSTMLDHGVKAELGVIQGALQFKPKQTPGFFQLSADLVLDTMTGIVYHDGQQTSQLPPHLHNHPFTRALDIHNYQYIWDPGAKEYLFYSKSESQKSTPTLRLGTDMYKCPIITKNLPTEFGREKGAFLRYVPKEDASFPICVKHRMNIAHFWRDEKRVYGYNEQDQLVAILSDSKVELEDDTYYFLRSQQLEELRNIPVFMTLENNFDLNELLTNRNRTLFYIPGLKAKIRKSIPYSPDSDWFFTMEGMPEKRFLPSDPGSSLLKIKNKNVDQYKVRNLERGIQKASDERIVRGTENPSLKRKLRLKELDNDLLQQKKDLIALEKPQLLTICENDAYRKEKSQPVFELFPDVIKELDGLDHLKDEPPVQLYPVVLNKIRNQINTLNIKNSSQSTLDPYFKAYLEIKKLYETFCDRPLEPVFFDISEDNMALTHDLTTALTLAMHQLNQDKPDFSLLLREIAKYPLQGSLSSPQHLLLENCINQVQKHKEAGFNFQAYLTFLCYQDIQFRLGEFATSPITGQEEQLHDEYEKSLMACKQLIETFEKGTKDSIAQEVLAIWKATGIHNNHKFLIEPQPKALHIKKQINPKLANELAVLSSKNLLERIKETDAIKALHKSPEQELSEQQQELSTAFKTDSPNQVHGFYFEKLGYFTLYDLLTDFRVDFKSGRGLYRFGENEIGQLFIFLKENRMIEPIPNSSLYYRLTSAKYAEKHFTENELRAHLAPLNLSEREIEQIIERIQSFLFRALQSGFEFSFKEGKEQQIIEKLNQEKMSHIQKFVEAEAILNHELQKHGASLVDLKYAYLTGDYGKFASKFEEENDKRMSLLSNALTRYLFHKTEAQHIENVLHAPAKGERNKIQLLQTKRNYSVDLLLHEGLQGKQRMEQIMQRTYLAYEEDYGNRCNLMQIRMFRSLMLGNKSHEGIDAIQARMGFGKTALLPLLAIVRIAKERMKPVEKRHLVRYVVPRAVREDNTNSFNQRLFSLLGKNVIQDKEFSRYQIDQENPSSSFQSILIDLKARLHFYEQIRKDGHMIIQTPEIRCSMEAQDADFAEMLRTKKLDRKSSVLCLQAKRLLVKIRSIPTYNVFDELDDTQDFKSREVNFTRGEKLSIPLETISPLEQLICYIEANKINDWSNKRERAQEMAIALLTDREGNRIKQCPEELITYLSDPTAAINDVVKSFLSESFALTIDEPSAHHTENDALLLLIRMVLLDDYILSLIRSKQPSTHFGIRFKIDPQSGERRYSYDPDTKSALLISVPYEGENNPKGLSVFDNREVAAITTFRYYLSQETNFEIYPHLDFLINQMDLQKIPLKLAARYLPSNRKGEHQAMQDLMNITRILDKNELKKAKQKFYETYMRNPSTEFRKFFGMVVLATQIRSDEGCAKSDRYEQGSPKDISLGCSGTVGDTSSYFTKQAPDPAADGMLSLEIMGRKNNSTVELLSPPKPNKDYLQQILSTLLDHAKANTRAIADIAGMCKSRDGNPETVIAELWKQLKSRGAFYHIEGIIYYGKDNVKRLYREGHAPIVCTTEMEIAAIKENRAYFTFYKQKNCRGSDVKQANHTHFLVPIDENVSNSDAKQTLLRFRNIVAKDSDQSFSFAAMPEYQEIVLHELKNQKNEELRKLRLQLTSLKDEIEQKRKSPHSERQAQSSNVKNLKQIYHNLKKQALDLEKDLQEGRWDQKKLEAKEIAYYLRIQEKHAEEENALTLFRKEMKAHLKVAAGHFEAILLSKLPETLDQTQKDAYIEYLIERNKLSPFIELALNGLYEKYGLATKTMDRDTFIAQEKQRTIAALDQLYQITNQCLLKYGINENILNKEMYIERINASVQTFTTRYPQDKQLQISGSKSDGQNVAQAQAQAQAEAEAEACRETILQTELEVQERLPTPNITLSTQPPTEVSFDFLTNFSALAGVENIPGLQYSIKPSLRHAYKVSPTLKTTQEVSHFVLANFETDHYIFISLEEAEAFKKHQESRFDSDEFGPLFDPTCLYTLIDIRNLSTSVALAPTPLPVDQYTNQLRCVALQDNQTPTDLHKIDTEYLRANPLLNVESHQLLPHLTYSVDDDKFTDFVKPKAFGVSQDMSYTLACNPVSEEKKFSLEVDFPTGNSKSITFPLDEEQLNPYMNRVYQDPTIEKNKLTQVASAIQAEIDKYKPELDLLKAQQAELDRLNQESQDEMAKVQDFDLTPTMRIGSKNRDYKLRIDHPNQASIGRDTISMCDEITKLLGELKANLDQDKLNQLKEKFSCFVSEDFIRRAKEKESTYEKELLFSLQDWTDKLNQLDDERDNALSYENKDFKKVSLLERVYGRIVLTVHWGANSSNDKHKGLLTAAVCPVEDCKGLFLLIPQLVAVTEQLQNAITAIEKNLAEKAAIELKIKEIEQKIGPWIRAQKAVEKLIKFEDEIETELKTRGLIFEKGTWFDQFDFSNFENMSTDPFTFQFEGKMPEYVTSGVTKDMESYRKIFHGLTPSEEETYQKSLALLAHVKGLAQQPINRETEISGPKK